MNNTTTITTSDHKPITFDELCSMMDQTKEKFNMSGGQVIHASQRLIDVLEAHCAKHWPADPNGSNYFMGMEVKVSKMLPKIMKDKEGKDREVLGLMLVPPADPFNMDDPFAGQQIVALLGDPT